jgi:monothiol glutaredoxin
MLSHSRFVATKTLSRAFVSRNAQSFAGVRFFSNDSHDDFAPQKTEIKDDDEAKSMIHEHVTNNRIMLYMKGNPDMPMCGFSATVVKTLKDEGADFSSVNVLDYPTIREGVKKYSQWPTIPQLYVDGEFIGGCDIITSMHESGELSDLVKEKK